MKLMNEIEYEMAGTIVEVVATNGKPVEYGDTLFRVRKS
jgi:acetyl-CoA carboxylase biotin carboxyl carrier protein